MEGDSAASPGHALPPFITEPPDDRGDGTKPKERAVIPLMQKRPEAERLDAAGSYLLQAAGVPAS